MTDTTLTGVPEYKCYSSSDIVAPSYVDGKCTVLDKKEICICEKDECNKGGKLIVDLLHGRHRLQSLIDGSHLNKIVSNLGWPRSRLLTSRRTGCDQV